MTDGFKLLEKSNGFQIQGNQSGGQTRLAFDTRAGVVGIIIDDDQLSLLLSSIVEHANQIAGKRTGTADIRVNFDPIPAQAVGVAKGPTHDTAFVTMLMGNLNLTFVVKKTALQSTYATLAREIL